MRTRLAATAALTAGLLALTACGSATGTLDAPATRDAVVRLADWTLRVGDTDTDAAAELERHPEFNRLRPGHVAVLVELEATYTGSAAEVTAWTELNPRLVIATGTAGWEYCGVFARDLAQVGEVTPGETVRARVCTQVPEADVAGAAWLFGADLSDSGGTTVALQ